MKFEINPYVRRAWNHRWSQNLVMERVIYDHEIIYIDKGKMKFTFKEQVYIADEGSCVIIPPNTYHKIEGVQDDTWQPHVHFDFFELPNSKNVPILLQLPKKKGDIDPTLFRKNFFEENNIYIPYVIKLQNPIKIRKLIFDIINNQVHQKPYSELTIKGLMINLVASILEDYESSINKENLQTDNIYELITHMITNINHNFKLEEMAEIAKTSVWNLIQAFNKLYGVTPKKFFEKYRLLHAKTLLEIEDKSVKEVAYEMEFDSPQSFTRWFKNLDENNPTFYRKKK